MATVISENPLRLDDIIANEIDKNLCRKQFIAEGAITRGQICKTGTAATQKSAVVAAGTGANAIALETVADTAPCWFLVFPGPVTVKRSGLTYGSGANATQKNDTDALLRAGGIVVLTVTV